jgi:hypothetical protein
MTRKLGYRWRLRELMAERGMYQTTDLVPLLAERGVRQPMQISWFIGCWWPQLPQSGAPSGVRVLTSLTRPHLEHAWPRARP